MPGGLTGNNGASGQPQRSPFGGGAGGWGGGAGGRDPSAMIRGLFALPGSNGGANAGMPLGFPMNPNIPGMPGQAPPQNPMTGNTTVNPANPMQSAMNGGGMGGPYGILSSLMGGMGGGNPIGNALSMMPQKKMQGGG